MPAEKIPLFLLPFLLFFLGSQDSLGNLRSILFAVHNYKLGANSKGGVIFLTFIMPLLYSRFFLISVGSSPNTRLRARRKWRKVLKNRNPRMKWRIIFLTLFNNSVNLYCNDMHFTISRSSTVKFERILKCSFIAATFS